jgi:hypothetical protein
MRVEDVYVQGRRTWVRLHEKGGKVHELPAITSSTTTCINIWKRPAWRKAKDPKGFLFRTVDWNSGELTRDRYPKWTPTA